MSLFENVIGSKTNFMRTDKNNELTGENSFIGDVIFEGNINGLEIADIPNLQTELNNKVNLSELQTEINERETADGILQNNIEQLQTILDTETLNRVNGDYLNQQAIILEGQTRAENDATLQTNINNNTEEIISLNTVLNENIDNLQFQINEKLDEANSNHFPNYSFYCVDNRNDLHSVLPNVNNQGSTISVSSGSFGNTDPLTIDKNNLAIYSVASTPPICEFNAVLTIPSTALRIRFNYLSFDNVCTLNGRNCVFSNTTFNNNCFIGEGMNTYQTYNNCEFSSGKTITFSNQLAGAVYFINCNIAGANLVFNNLSPLLVIFSNCSGFVSLPTTSQATLIGLNVKADGTIVQHNISKIVLPTGEGTNNQVLTSTGSGNCIWSNPSGGGGGSDIIKERFTRYCQGQIVNTSKGNITLPNITTQQEVNTNVFTWTDLLGSSINYNPPTGTTFVEYELSFYCYTFTPLVAQETYFSTALYIDNVQQDITRQRIILSSVPSGPGQMNYKFKAIISITGTTDTTKCSLNSWNTSKNIKLQLLREQSNRVLTLHLMPDLFFNNGVVNTIIPPIITITAY